MDTRNNWGFVQHGPMTPGQRLSVQVTGQGNVPASGVTGVVMNVTVTAPTASGYLRVTPEGGTSTTSSLNFVPGQVVPNLVTVPVPPSGVVDFYNPAGDTHVIADVVGYYGPAVSEAGRFIPIASARGLRLPLQPPRSAPARHLRRPPPRLVGRGSGRHRRCRRAERDGDAADRVGLPHRGGRRRL